MLAVGALLLAASGGYYAYAQFAKTGRADLVHEVARPTFTDRTSPTYTEIEDRLGNSALGQSQAMEVASVASSAISAASRTETVYTDTEKLTSPGQAEAIQTPVEAPRDVTAYTAEEAGAWIPSAEQISMIAGPVDGRIGTAIEELLYLQALRPGYVPKEEPEVQADAELIEPSQNTSRLASVILPNQDRNPETSGEMISELRESEFERTSPSVPVTKYATRMIIPEIGLRASVEELEVVEEDDSRAWETPKHVVGHIPTTAKPGTSGQGWYFGHLESPISGEGNIFRRLPELAARFKRERDNKFTIYLDAGNDRYVYQVYQTDVVHASEFAVSDSGKNDITLVACWPQFEYSERVLVTAALVDVVEIPEAERIQPSSG